MAITWPPTSAVIASLPRHQMAEKKATQRTARTDTSTGFYFSSKYNMKLQISMVSDGPRTQHGWWRCPVRDGSIFSSWSSLGRWLALLAPQLHLVRTCVPQCCAANVNEWAQPQARRVPALIRQYNKACLDRLCGEAQKPEKCLHVSMQCSQCFLEHDTSDE